MNLAEVSYDHPVEKLDAVAAAIEAAGCPDREGPFGLFDYTEYGDPRPHHVRDFRDPRSPSWGKAVHVGEDREEARCIYEEMTRRHVAEAALAAWAAVDGPPPGTDQLGRVSEAAR